MNRTKHTTLILMALCLTAGAWAQPASDAPKAQVGKAIIQINGQKPIEIDLSKEGIDVGKVIAQAMTQGKAMATGNPKALHAAYPRWRLGVMIAPNKNPAGVMIKRVLPNSVAAKAGLKAGDVIVSAGGKKTATYDALQAVLKTTAKSIPLGVVRGGKAVKVTAAFPQVIQGTIDVAQPAHLAHPGRTIRTIRLHPGITIQAGGDPEEQMKNIRKQLEDLQKRMQQAQGRIQIAPGQGGGATVQLHTEIITKDEQGNTVTVGSDGKTYTVTRDGITNTYDSKAALEQADPAAAKLMGGIKIQMKIGGAGALPMPPMPNAPDMEAAIRKALQARVRIQGQPRIPAPGQGGKTVVVGRPQVSVRRMQPVGGDVRVVTIGKAELQAMIESAVKKAMADCMKQCAKGGCKCGKAAPPVKPSRKCGRTAPCIKTVVRPVAPVRRGCGCSAR